MQTTIESFDKATSSRLARAARVLAGYTQVEASTAFGISLRALQSLEAGEGENPVLIGMMEGLNGCGITVTREISGATVIWREDRVIDEEDERHGTLLAAARTFAGLTQEQLAEAAGVSVRTVVTVEKGGRGLASVRDSIVKAIRRRRVGIVQGDGRHGITLLAPGELPVPSSEGYLQPIRGIRDAMQAVVDSMDPGRPSFVHCRVELSGAATPIWREFLFPVNASFEDLHRVIQVTFGWSGERLHVFNAGLEISSADYIENGDLSAPRALDEREVRLQDVNLGRFEYAYDLMGGWPHHVVMGAVVHPEGRDPRPIVVDGEGMNPVESFCSLRIWNQVVEGMRDGTLTDEDREELAGFGSDPAAFDLEECNRRIGAMDFDIPKTWKDEHARSLARRRR